MSGYSGLMIGHRMEILFIKSIFGSEVHHCPKYCVRINRLYNFGVNMITCLPPANESSKAPGEIIT